jgi:hypothetical protein
VNLLVVRPYTSLTMLGTNDPTGITLTNPTYVAAIALALRTTTGMVQCHPMVIPGKLDHVVVVLMNLLQQAVYAAAVSAIQCVLASETRIGEVLMGLHAVLQPKQ